MLLVTRSFTLTEDPGPPSLVLVVGLLVVVGVLLGLVVVGQEDEEGKEEVAQGRCTTD